MVLTEEEAKQKLCPFAGLANLITHSLSDVIENYSCSASGCMMWRWKETCFFEQSRPLRTGLSGEFLEAFVLKPPHMVVREITPTRGYCGLAGKVE